MFNERTQHTVYLPRKRRVGFVLQCSGVEKVLNVVVLVCLLCHKSVSSVCITARVQNEKHGGALGCMQKKKNANILMA